MTDDPQDRMEPQGRGCMTLLVIAPIAVGMLVLAGPLIGTLFNAVALPGLNTCKTEIRKILRDPDSAKFDLPLRDWSSRSNPEIHGYDMEVSATNGFGGRNVRVYRCTIDETRSPATYRITY